MWCVCVCVHISPKVSSSGLRHISIMLNKACSPLGRRERRGEGEEEGGEGEEREGRRGGEKGEGGREGGGKDEEEGWQ